MNSGYILIWLSIAIATASVAVQFVQTVHI